MVATLDGCSLPRLTKDVRHFDAPFDARFRDMSVATCHHGRSEDMRIPSALRLHGER